LSENTYYADPESADEMTRLSHQGQMLNQALTLLPIDPLNRLNKTESLQVLDVGSGPGDWALELAVTYPFLRIISIDISERMVAYARARAESQETPNVEFWIMNALKPLGFPDASFDLVHIRAAVGFILREQWIPVFQECKRVLRPGGVLISTEGENGTFTYHSPNTAQLIHWLGRVLFVKGLGFWDDMVRC
jgi:ubiquinone/menaquinone biosynthesis C-methylase UbiE